MSQEPETLVIFRKWPARSGGGILALFPCASANRNENCCQSYEHIGQHGTALLEGCIYQTTPATPAEYADLKGELEGRGYRLKVMQRTPASAYDLRRAEIEGVHA